MGTITVEQFNPKSQCWNKLYEVDAEDFDQDAPFAMDRYGGPYRVRDTTEVRVVDEPVEVFKPEPLKRSWFSTKDEDDGEID